MKYLLTLVFATLTSFQVIAADLNSKDITRWMKSMPELQGWLETNEDKLSSQISDPEDPEVIFAESMSALKKSGLYDELNSKVTKLGYKNAEEWSDISQRITFSWISLELDANKAEMDAAKAQFDAMIKNPEIPAKQKEMMEEMMKAGLAMTRLAAKASPEDKKVITTHKAELRAYFERDDMQ